MKKPEIVEAILARAASSRLITKRFIASLSPKLLQLCLDKSTEKPFSRVREQERWTAVLHRYVYGKTVCRACGGDNLLFKSFSTGYTTYCSAKCAGADPEVDIKRKKTNIRVHGVERPQQHIPEIREKFLATMQSKYGVSYGGESRKLRSKAKKTSLKRYGVDSPLKSAEVRQKISKTVRERYGVDFVMQNREIFERQQESGFESLEFEIGGKTFKLRGYEHHAVKWLIDKGVKPRHICTTAAEGVPSIEWFDIAGVRHLYHPDAYVKYKGKWYLLEIKSTFTLGIMEHVKGNRSGKFAYVQRKAKACYDAGYRYKLLVIAKNKGRKTPTIVVVNNIHNISKRTVREKLKLLRPGEFRQL